MQNNLPITEQKVLKFPPPPPPQPLTLPNPPPPGCRLDPFTQVFEFWILGLPDHGAVTTSALKTSFLYAQVTFQTVLYTSLKPFLLQQPLIQIFVHNSYLNT